MSLITRCPACETLFKVVPDQLRISQGWVRCGQCGEIFDASADLRQHEAGPYAVQPVPTAQPPELPKPPVPLEQIAPVQNLAPAWVQPAVDIELTFPEEPAAPPGPERQAEPGAAVEQPVAIESPVPLPDGSLAMAQTEVEEAATDEHFAPSHADEEPVAEADGEREVVVEYGAEVQPEAAVEAAAADAGMPVEVGHATEAKEVGPEPEPEAEAEAGRGTPSDARAEVPAENVSQAQPASSESSARVASAEDLDDPQSITEALTSSEAEPEPEPEPELEVEARAEADTQAGTEAGVESDTQAPTEAEPESELEAEAAQTRPDSPPLIPLPGRAALDMLADGATVAATSPHAEFNHHDVSFIRQAPDPATRRRTSLHRALWVFAGVAALVALLLQMALHERDNIAAAAPALRPLLQAMCAPMQCRVQPLREIEAIVIDGSSFSALRNEGYKLSLTLRNRAAHVIAVPAIELSLIDIREQPVLRRVLLPSEMGAGTAVLPARGEWSTTLELAVADGAGRSRIVGYRLLAFYP